MAGDVTNEIGEKDEGAFQDGDDVQVVGIVAPDFHGELGATLVSPEEARAIVTTWLTTPMREPRYIRRLAKIRDLENRD